MVTALTAPGSACIKIRQPADRLTPEGVSYACPVAPNKTEDGRAKNRRVALVEGSP